MKTARGFLILISVCTVLFTNIFITVNAEETDSITAGTYPIQANLSCYVNAMGGVEFGEPLLTGAEVTVSESNNKTITLFFTKAQVTIYSITCDTFVDAAPETSDNSSGIENGAIGYYDISGTLCTDDVTYTLSDDTALNSRNEEVHYVSSVTFPVDRISDSYNLTMYINSNVMGVQFSNSNDTSTGSAYPATLTVDWNSLTSNEANVTSAEATDTADSEQSDSDNDSLNTEINEEIVTKDGLNIHYTDSTNSEETVSDTADDNTYSIYLNKPALIAATAAALFLILIGVIFVVSSAERKEKK
jgi:hypothetical protein